MSQRIAMVAAGAISLVVALVAAVSLTGAGSASSSSPPTLRIGTYYWPGMYWIDIADKKGWFAKAGLNVTLRDANDDYYSAVDDVLEGSLDTIDLWLFDTIQRNREGAELVMVLATDVSNGSEAIVADPGINSVPGLQGKRIGVTHGTALVYELEVMLNRFGMDTGDVTLVDMVTENAAEQLKSGNVAAVMSWEPYVSEAVNAGGKRLYDSSRLSGLMPAGMVFRQDFINRRPRDIQRLLDVWLRTTRYIRDHPDDSFAIIAEKYDVAPDDVAAFAESNQILGLDDNIRIFTYASGPESLFGSARRINRYFVTQTRGATEPVAELDLLNGHFVRMLYREEVRQ